MVLKPKFDNEKIPMENHRDNFIAREENVILFWSAVIKNFSGSENSFTVTVVEQ